MIQAVKCEQHLVCSVSPPRIKYPAVSQRRQHLNDLHQPSVFDMDVINLWRLEKIRLDVSRTRGAGRLMAKDLPQCDASNPFGVKFL